VGRTLFRMSLAMDLRRVPYSVRQSHTLRRVPYSVRLTVSHFASCAV